MLSFYLMGWQGQTEEADLAAAFEPVINTSTDPTTNLSTDNQSNAKKYGNQQPDC